jgi:hypothetical protein
VNTPVLGHTWAAPFNSPAIAPDLTDRKAESEKLGWQIGYSGLIAGDKLDYRDVIEPIYEETSNAVGKRGSTEIPAGAGSREPS